MTITHIIDQRPGHGAHRESFGPETELTVRAWHDPMVEAIPGAIPTASDEALIWWTPSVGPTGMLMAHRFATYAAEGLTVWTVADIAATFGMGTATRRVFHTLDRLERFGLVSVTGTSIAVRLTLAPLSARQRARLPQYLADGIYA
jgi:hypothetical protein